MLDVHLLTPSALNPEPGTVNEKNNEGEERHPSWKLKVGSSMLDVHLLTPSTLNPEPNSEGELK